MFCPSCSGENPAAARFCMTCGVALAGARRTLGSEGSERKQVTVLFADIVGSTELIGDMDPEDAQSVLDGAVAVMMAAVRRYGGTVTQTRGDSIVALFGAPVAHEDHAIRACYAALAIHKGIGLFPPQCVDGQAVKVEIRAGLNSGEVVVRSTANDLSREYTAMGEAVHLAERMEQVARPGTTIISPSTRALVDGYVGLRPLPAVAVKGMTGPVGTWELLGAGPARPVPASTWRRPGA